MLRPIGVQLDHYPSLGVYGTCGFCGQQKGYSNINFLISCFLCRSVYNCILGRPFASILDIVASPVHLKLGYHNLQGELTTIKDDLEGVKRIHQALHKDRGEGIAKRIHQAL
ncbi:hypothetical protein KIW84_015036, partial [Lathyrus oleraceus]